MLEDGDVGVGVAQVYLAQARPQEALAEMEREPELRWRLFGLALAYHALGKKKESDANLSQSGVREVAVVA